MRAEKHSMIVLLDFARAEVYKSCAKEQKKNLSNWVRLVLDKACRQAGKEPEQWLEEETEHALTTTEE